MKRALIVLAMAALSPASADVRPTPGAGDPRIQTVLYDPDQVIQLQVASGYQLTLEFGADERIENVAIGDSSAWQVTPNKRGDHLFIKASQGSVATNMTVVTDARTYTFALATGYGAAPDMSFTVRIKYPPPIPVPDVVTAATIGRYHLSGARALQPSEIDDDGVHTYINWATSQAMPAVYAVDDRGNEALVNGMVRETRYVIDSVSNKLVFRLDRAVAYATRRPRMAAP